MLFFCGGCAEVNRLAARTAGWVPGLHGSKKASPPAPAQSAVTTVAARDLALVVEVQPFPVRLSEARRMEVRIRLQNVSRRFVHLDFPTSQRFEAVLRTPAGRGIAQWSEDQVFEPVPCFVGINPGESVEYRAVLPTRDLQPGQPVLLAVSFPGHPALHAERLLTPER